MWFLIYAFFSNNPGASYLVPPPIPVSWGLFLPLREGGLDLSHSESSETQAGKLSLCPHHGTLAQDLRGTCSMNKTIVIFMSLLRFGACLFPQHREHRRAGGPQHYCDIHQQCHRLDGHSVLWVRVFVATSGMNTANTRGIQSTPRRGVKPPPRSGSPGLTLLSSFMLSHQRKESN